MHILLERKKIFLFFTRIIACLFFLFGVFLNGAQDVRGIEQTVPVYFFWGDGCPHCAREEIFLKSLEERRSNVVIRDFEVWFNKTNQKLFVSVGKKLNADVSGTPFTVVGDQYFVGYYTDETTGKDIERAIDRCSVDFCPDIVGSLITPIPTVAPSVSPIGGSDSLATSSLQSGNIPEYVNIPFFGSVRVSALSLPILSIVLGGLDGFNPCAMWVLIFLISLLLGMENRKRMWILGSAFIVASAAVYFLFMAAWLNILLFIGFIIWIRGLIALVAVGGGAYNIWKYIRFVPGCSVAGEKRRSRIFERLQAITQQKRFWLALIGIVVLAAGVNMVELLCSAGLPVVFTQVLALNNLSLWQYYAYMLLYIFVFMLDDLIIFIVAMITLRVTGLTTTYTKYSHLIGGILMIIVGLLLFFKPQWLMFG